jgi:hypothetical protein
MTYAKPEVSILGNASSVIERLVNKRLTYHDGVVFVNPAYDPDE